jgi:hypothetical protein
MKQTRYAVILLLIVTSITQLQAWDNLHFYRPPFVLYAEPRFERPGLTTVNVRIGAGGTSTSRNGCSRKSCLLDIYGPQNMFKLGENVPGKDLTNPRDLTLQMLEVEPARDGFGLFSFGGKFSIIEAGIQIQQNISDGFFLEFYMPVRKIKLSNLSCNDLSPCAACPGDDDPIWQSFLNQYGAILSDNCISLCDQSETGVGDTSVILGWTTNYEESEHLDFVDFTMQAGVLFPTAKRTNINRAFAIPLGYNGHYGFPVNMALAFGMYEWLTIGGHAMALPFKKRCQELRMKTSTPQNGWIKLAQGSANVDRGTLWHIGMYTKADHIIRGLSLLLGYSFAAEREWRICPSNCAVFDIGVANSDEALRGWKMHTIHLIAEWDFLKERCLVGPRVGIFGNFVIGGKRIFNTQMGGGMIGLDLVWNY